MAGADGELGGVGSLFREGKTAGLSISEKRIVKRLFSDGLTNQDVHAKINFGRGKTVNFSRISSVKKDNNQDQADKDEISDFKRFKSLFDPKTGLHPFKNERLVKSREAIILAISVFNNPMLIFRTEQFLVLANIAWTYFALEYAHTHDMITHRENGKEISLTDFINDEKCPFSEGIKLNLKAMGTLRNAVEHKVLGQEDPSWIALFQANCLNFEKTIVEEFGEELSLKSELSFALQFSGLSIGQATSMAKLDLPPEISAINAEIFDDLKPNELDDQEFRFSVVYTTVATSKSKAAFNFVSPEDIEGKEIADVLIKYKPGPETHPHTAKDVWEKVASKTGKKFNSYNHSQAWKRHEVRPQGNPVGPVNTKTAFCYYNKPLKTYTYSDSWIEKLCKELN